MEFDNKTSRVISDFVLVLNVNKL